jgi:hypothetical protein
MGKEKCLRMYSHQQYDTARQSNGTFLFTSSDKREPESDSFHHCVLNLSEILLMDEEQDIATCSPLKVNRSFGGTYRLQLHGRKIRQPRNQNEWYSRLSSTLKLEET